MIRWSHTVACLLTLTVSAVAPHSAEAAPVTEMCGSSCTRFMPRARASPWRQVPATPAEASELAPKDSMYSQLGVSAEGFEYTVQPIEAWLALRDLRVVLLRTCHVQIEGEAELLVTFLDADAKRVHVSGRSHGAPTRRKGASVPRPSLAFVA